MINVTKAFLPPIEKYVEYLQGIWQRCHLTNHGPLVNELEESLRKYFGVKHCFFINNGTIALQIAIKALELKGEVITTPFSYVATTSSLSWENVRPVFVDIDPATLTIDASKIESAITPATTGIMATHVYGIPCNVEEIESIARRHGLKVIYDAAHAFGVSYKGNCLLNYGDVSTLSFHATKLFHTVEGGAIVTNDDMIAHKISFMRNFGHNGQEDFFGIGINGKSSEFHAAMGLCIFPMIGEIIARRKLLCEYYDRQIASDELPVTRPLIPQDTGYNYAYYPVLFPDEKSMLAARERLNKEDIFPRRYFYPSLNLLPYTIGGKKSMPVAESVSSRVLCLPLYHDLREEEVEKICQLIRESVRVKQA